MAEAKKTTAAAKKPVAKKEATVVKSVEDLKKELAEKQDSFMETRRSHRTGELVNPRAITTSRKEIARLHTAIRAAELSAKESK